MRSPTSLFLFACLVSANCLGQTRLSQSRQMSPNCPAEIKVLEDEALEKVSLPPTEKCSVSSKNGFLVPDPKCTPGAINPSLTLDVLKNPNFATACVRDKATQPIDKAATYRWYQIPKPTQNAGETQTCELDHFISLELGGADTLDNIWPQCGPSGVTLDKRFFKRKDTVENYLAKQVRDGKMSLTDAQKGIAADWTQYLTVAEQDCPGGQCK
jgi:hypothetical protein